MRTLIIRLKLYSGFSLTKEKALLIIAAFGYSIIVYKVGRLFAISNYHSMLTSLDLEIPLIPWTVTIYLGCYLFWGINYILAAGFSKEDAKRFITAHVIGETLCLFTFLFLPARIVRPDITGTSIFDFALKFVYSFDDPDNLFPSVHCFISWLSWIGVRKNKAIPGVYRYCSLIMAILICISAVTTKQHVLADVFAGIILAEASYIASGKTIKKL